MTNLYLDPIAAAEQPRKDLIRYLLTAYPLRNPDLRAGLENLLNTQANIWQSPYLEGSQPYRPAESIADLIKAGVLHPEMARLFTADRCLYEHQTKAVRAVMEEQRNIIVATGTGSGKTECFLLPMIDGLLKEEANLDAGVRALILYPMNALVNDQVKRLRQILCHQRKNRPLIRFGFYTSRTEREEKSAQRSLEEEIRAYSNEDLLALFPSEQHEKLRLSLSNSRREDVVAQACKTVQSIQAISRAEIQKNPPHILVTNYSMLEHMLIRPTERREIFERSAGRFRLLVVDEAHSYDGATGTEVSMLIKRLKTAMKIEATEQIRCIATSASLGNRDDERVNQEVAQFAGDLFGEPFSLGNAEKPITPIIWGDRVLTKERLGDPYSLPEELAEDELYDYFAALKLPALSASLEDWCNQLSYIAPHHILESAKSQVVNTDAGEQIHKFIWLALKGHPTVHNLIQILSRSPQPWEWVAQSQELWQLPTTIDGEVTPHLQDLEAALANLVQLGTLARERPHDLPLLPVRLHLLFRSMEGVYACINPKCSQLSDSETATSSKHAYGKLYLNERKRCDCGSPVLELSSCRKCGQEYNLAHLGNQGELLTLPRSLEAVEDSKRIYVLTPRSLEDVTLDEDVEELDEIVPSEGVCLLSETRDGWIGRVARPEQAHLLKPAAEQQVSMIWHMPPKTKNADGGYLSQCPACGARRNQSSPIGRFISYTDAPLEVMLDSLFELLPDPDWKPGESTKRKLLTFSDGRQDAAFFASDFQRTHTETLYRQMVWQTAQAVMANNGTASVSVNQVQEKLVQQFLQISIPHPDRESAKHHLSYVPLDEMEREENLKNPKDCEERAKKRAKELMLREFGLPSARRFSIESLGLLTCHIDWNDRHFVPYVEKVAQYFETPESEALVFLTELTDMIRLSGIVNVDKPSDYFPEVGGVDGSRPGILDKSGRIKRYLKFQKATGDDRDAVSLCWYRTANNRLIKTALFQYCSKVLGISPEKMTEEQSKDILFWLYDQILIPSQVLVKYGKEGRQLNWELLNIQQVSTDWCRCDTCRQVSHVPGFSMLSDRPVLNIKCCPAFKCNGKLGALNVQQLNDDHYRHLIQERKILPLRSQEHTAQLGTDELAARESRFRQGKINLLSCSTTLEMGVDIGELQAVALRNFPPHVSNYQQRAGRAGRRTDGVAITLMYGQRRPHDRYYFEQPERLIAGKNKIPKLDPQNFQVQERHIRAELLAEFLRNKNQSAEEVTVADFLGLSIESHTIAPDSASTAGSRLADFQMWLASSHAIELTELWLLRLGGNRESLIHVLLNSFDKKLVEFQSRQLQDWNGLVEVRQEVLNCLINPPEAKSITNYADRLKSIQKELEKVGSRRLHDELARASILPIYGFPIDVVRLMTGEGSRYGSSQGRHRLERDRRLALGEYAPGQDIVVDDRVHTSVGIVNPSKLEKLHYWVCKHCNYFTSDHQKHQHRQCPICRTLPSTPSECNSRVYKIPNAFTTEWRKLPKVTPYTKPTRQPTSQVFLAKEGKTPEALSQPTDPYQLLYSQGGEFFLSNQGPLEGGKGFRNQGFAICHLCGCDLSTQIRELQKKSKPGKTTATAGSSNVSHLHPMSDRPCPGGYEWMHLGHKFLSDLLKVRFSAVPTNYRLSNPVTHQIDGQEITSVDETMVDAQKGFWRSLTSALLAAASQAIDVPRTELDGLFRLSENTSDGEEIVIYDNVPGGAGYSRRIGQQFRDVLQRAYQIVESCPCDSSCYDCLRTYSNQPFHHQINRRLVEKFLRPLVEQVNPEQYPKLQAFAPDATKISEVQLENLLPIYCHKAALMSLIYLPKIQTEDSLNLKRLVEMVDSLRSCNSPLELILHRLPEPNSFNIALRKRLQQWMDLGYLKLYQVNINQEPELCLSTECSHAIALKFQSAEADAPAHWIQTQSSRGVKVVSQRLEQLQAQARLVSAEELTDANAQVIFPDPTWVNLSLKDLRKKLGLEQILQGSSVIKVTYSDRYFKELGAEILAKLLQGEWLNANSQMSIQLLQSKDEENNGTMERLKTVKGKMAQHLQTNLKFEMRPFRKRHSPPFPHGRELTI